jgi:hypothetical protein
LIFIIKIAKSSALPRIFVLGKKGETVSGDTPQNFTKKFRFGVDSG